MNVSVRKVIRFWKYGWSNWGPRPVNGGRQFVPPGHFYSPIPGLDDVRLNQNAIFDDVPRTIAGINIQESEQLSLLNQFKNYYDELPFRAKKTPPLRYFFDNPAYSYSDAILLYSMIRHVKPQRIIEVGSGYSSCLMLDTQRIVF